MKYDIDFNRIHITAAKLYYSDKAQAVAHAMKHDIEAVRYVACILAKLIPQNSVLVPVPGHHGYADHTLLLANEINSIIGIPVADVLKGKERKSLYQAKKDGTLLSEDDLTFRLCGILPDCCTPVILDNVVGTGTTVLSAAKAIGYGRVVVFAVDDTFYHRNKQ